MAAFVGSGARDSTGHVADNSGCDGLIILAQPIISVIMSTAVHAEATRQTPAPCSFMRSDWPLIRR